MPEESSFANHRSHRKSKRITLMEKLEIQKEIVHEVLAFKAMQCDREGMNEGQTVFSLGMMIREREAVGPQGW